MPFLVNNTIKKFFEKKFQVDEVIKIKPPVPPRGQLGGSSCGVHQCLFMADLALGVPNWLSKDYDKEYMENYRLTIGRRILNFDGAQCLEITQFDKQSRDFYIRKEVSKTKKSSFSRTTTESPRPSI